MNTPASHWPNMTGGGLLVNMARGRTLEAFESKFPNAPCWRSCSHPWCSLPGLPHPFCHHVVQWPVGGENAALVA